METEPDAVDGQDDRECFILPFTLHGCFAARQQRFEIGVFLPLGGLPTKANELHLTKIIYLKCVKLPIGVALWYK